MDREVIEKIDKLEIEISAVKDEKTKVYESRNYTYSETDYRLSR